ncbi:MAG: 50S ribosomal protein L34e [Candidatus Helarchaeota archaeon]|nr:50S ribosomal protein L34e [Candidatus Helarchaeota archaeon]
MPAPRHRSRSKNQKKIVTPGKIVKTHYKKPTNQFCKCARCGTPIKSIPRLRGPSIHKFGKSKRRPSRIYGGYYCPNCLSLRLRDAVRKMA